MWFLGFVLPLCLVISRIQGQCVDNVSADRWINVNDDDGNKIDQAESCGEIMKKWPELCEFPLVGGKGGRCCVSCGDTKCLDKVTSYQPLTVGDEKIKSCKKAVKKYPYICQQEGKKGGRCCRTCKGVNDVNCQDALTKFPLKNKFVSCKKYIKSDPCNCAQKNIKRSCCASCKDVSTNNCKCQDTLSANRKAAISITKNGNTFNKDITDCQEIADYFSRFCAEDKLGGNKNVCCKSCEGVDTTCFDDLSWRISVDGCQDCDCHDLRRAGKKLMKKVCKQDLQGGTGNGRRVRKACCLQCSRVGF